MTVIAIDRPSPSTPSRLRALFRLAWKESRTARRRLLLYMSSISLGVAALVAIDSYAGNVKQSIRMQSRALLGGDLAFRARTAWPKPLDALLDSLSRSGVTISRVTTFTSMAIVDRGTGTRLVQVRAVSREYPLYGEVVTQPRTAWSQLQHGSNAIVDPSLLIALDAHIGDSVSLGYAKFRIAGTIEVVPGDPGMSAAIGPRVFIPASSVAATKLLGFGSRAEYEAFAKLPETADPAPLARQYRRQLQKAQIHVRTLSDNEQGLTNSIDEMSRFLGIVGLVALLLGGIGVASGVHAFVQKKIDTVAVLRCVGATSRQVLLIYVSQAAIMGLAGAAIGAALGIAIQFALPRALGRFLPVDVVVTLEPLAIAFGLGLGLWIALAFALRPLLALRDVSPLQALRHDAGGVRRRGIRAFIRDWPRLLVGLLLVGSVYMLAATRADTRREALITTAAIGGVIGALALSAWLLSWAARKSTRAKWPYVVRQGIANLHRPANQTRSVILSLGFGAFLISTLYLVQANLLRQFDVTAQKARGNLLFFDVQEDQAPTIDSIVRARGLTVLERVPIVTMRIAAINGRTVSALLADSVRRGGGGWALRREFRSTFRDTMTTSETLTAGKWFHKTPVPEGAPVSEVSLDQGVARELRVKVGDVITWDVQGVQVPTRLTSLRDVTWARFEPNFFAVFTPDALHAAPKMFVLLTNANEAAAAARLQRAVVEKYPNASSIDLSLVRKTIDEIVGRVSMAIRFLTIFSLAMGIPVLFSAVAATRRERVREGVLLKTLGATRRQIGRILVAEYAALGVLGALTGMLLSFGAAWALLRWIFERPFAPATVAALSIALAMVALTVSIGLLSGRDVFRETPMAALREG